MGESRLACQAGDWRLLGELAVDLVHTTLSALPQAIAERWLGAVPPPVADDPAFHGRPRELVAAIAGLASHQIAIQVNSPSPQRTE